MKFKIRSSVSAKHSVITGMMIGVLCSFVMSLLLVVCITTLAISGKINNNVIEVALFIIRFCSVCVGIVFGTGWTNEKCLLISTMVVFGYLSLLVCLSTIIYDSFLSGILGGTISAAFGAGAGIAIRLKIQGSSKKARKMNKIIVHN